MTWDQLLGRLAVAMPPELRARATEDSLVTCERCPRVAWASTRVCPSCALGGPVPPDEVLQERFHAGQVEDARRHWALLLKEGVEPPQAPRRRGGPLPREPWERRRAITGATAGWRRARAKGAP